VAIDFGCGGSILVWITLCTEERGGLGLKYSPNDLILLQKSEKNSNSCRIETGNDTKEKP